MPGYLANARSAAAADPAKRLARSRKYEAVRVYTEADYERYRVNARRWARENPEKHAAQCNRYRARKASAPGSHTVTEWAAIKTKQRGRCADCREKKPLTRDHITPLSKGGSDYAFNIQGLCKPCNSRKSAKVRAGLQYSLFDVA